MKDKTKDRLISIASLGGDILLISPFIFLVLCMFHRMMIEMSAMCL